MVTVKMDGALAGRILAGRAAADASLEDGAEVQLAIRPEDIVVAADESPRPDDHTLPGVIEALLFVGDRYEARVALGRRAAHPAAPARAVASGEKGSGCIWDSRPTG